MEQKRRTVAGEKYKVVKSAGNTYIVRRDMSDAYPASATAKTHIIILVASEPPPNNFIL